MILHNANYRFSSIPIKIPITFSRNGKDDPQLHMGLQEFWIIANTDLKKRTKLEGSHFLIPNSTTKVQCSAVWWWHKDEHTGQHTGTESRSKPRRSRWTGFQQRSQDCLVRKEQHLQRVDVHVPKNNADSCFTPHRKINLGQKN